MARRCTNILGEGGGGEGIIITSTTHPNRGEWEGRSILSAMYQHETLEVYK